MFEEERKLSGEILRWIRKDKVSMSQMEFSEQLTTVSGNEIGFWERGERQPSKRVAKEVVKYLTLIGVDITPLMEALIKEGFSEIFAECNMDVVVSQTKPDEQYSIHKVRFVDGEKISEFSLDNNSEMLQSIEYRREFALGRLLRGDYSTAKEVVEVLDHIRANSSDSVCQLKAIKALLLILKAWKRLKDLQNTAIKDSPPIISTKQQIKITSEDFIRLDIENLRTIRDRAIIERVLTINDLKGYYFRKTVPQLSLIYIPFSEDTVDFNVLCKEARYAMIDALIKILNNEKDFAARTGSAFLLTQLSPLYSQDVQKNNAQILIENVKYTTTFGALWFNWLCAQALNNRSLLGKDLKGKLEQIQYEHPCFITRFAPKLVLNTVTPSTYEEACKIASAIFSHHDKLDIDNPHVKLWTLCELCRIAKKLPNYSRCSMSFQTTKEVLQKALDCPYTTVKLVIPDAIASIFPYLTSKGQREAKELLNKFQEAATEWDDEYKQEATSKAKEISMFIEPY